MSVDGFDGETYQVENTDSAKLREILAEALEYTTDRFRLMPLDLLTEQIAEVQDELKWREVRVLADRYFAKLGTAAPTDEAERDDTARALFLESRYPKNQDRPLTRYVHFTLTGEGVLN